MKIKNLLSSMIFLMAIPFVSATDYFQGLDLFNLFVENVFGNILFSGFGLAALFIIICITCRMSLTSIIFLVGTFVMTFSMGYFGALAAVPLFIVAFAYFANSMINYLNLGQT